MNDYATLIAYLAALTHLPEPTITTVLAACLAWTTTNLTALLKHLFTTEGQATLIINAALNIGLFGFSAYMSGAYGTGSDAIGKAILATLVAFLFSQAQYRRQVQTQTKLQTNILKAQQHALGTSGGISIQGITDPHLAHTIRANLTPSRHKE